MESNDRRISSTEGIWANIIWEGERILTTNKCRNWERLFNILYKKHLSFRGIRDENKTCSDLYNR